MKKIDCIVLNPCGEPDITTVLADYREVKKKIDISTPVDCISRKIGEKYFDIWCDDEGLLKEQLNASAFCRNANEILAGKILICNSKDEKMASLTPDDTSLILDNLKRISKDFDVEYETNIGVVNMNFKAKGVILEYSV